MNLYFEKQNYTYKENQKAISNFFSIIVLDNSIGMQITQNRVIREISKHLKVKLFEFKKKTVVRKIAFILTKSWNENLQLKKDEVNYILENIPEINQYKNADITHVTPKKKSVIYLVKKFFFTLFKKNTNLFILNLTFLI